jgi:hypothetical protein
MENNLPPCFFCECPAEYTGELVEKNNEYQVVEVCKYHFKGFLEASS